MEVRTVSDGSCVGFLLVCVEGELWVCLLRLKESFHYELKD